jgi:hypothetical protein
MKWRWGRRLLGRTSGVMPAIFIVACMCCSQGLSVLLGGPRMMLVRSCPGSAAPPETKTESSSSLAQSSKCVVGPYTSIGEEACKNNKLRCHRRRGIRTVVRFRGLCSPKNDWSILERKGLASSAVKKIAVANELPLLSNVVLQFVLNSGTQLTFSM